MKKRNPIFQRGVLRPVLAPEPKVSNTTIFTIEDIEKQPVYGRFNNKWRGRLVTVYRHPGNPDTRVLTLGAAYNGDRFYCDEPMEAYARRIKHNDWSDFN